MERILHYTWITSILLGCASSYKRPGSIESEMVRFQSKRRNQHHLPKIKTVHFQYASRGISSIPDITLDANNKSIKHSNKQLYFLTLYLQYKEFTAYTQNKVEDISFCPQFHTTFLKHKGKDFRNLQAKRLYRPTFNRSNLDAASYPELSLLTADNLSVEDQIKNNPKRDIAQIVLAGIESHRKNIYEELLELCEYGRSEHYYAYENLIGNRDRETALMPNNAGVEILFKIAPFANNLILDSLRFSSKKWGRRIASNKNMALLYKTKANPYYKAIVQRIGTPWMKDYLKQVAEQRKK